MHKPQRLRNLSLKFLTVLHWSKDASILRPEPWLVQVPSATFRKQIRVSYSLQETSLKRLKEMGFISAYQVLLDKSFMVRLIPPASLGMNSPEAQIDDMVVADEATEE